MASGSYFSTVAYCPKLPDVTASTCRSNKVYASTFLTPPKSSVYAKSV